MNCTIWLLAWWLPSSLLLKKSRAIWLLVIQPWSLWQGLSHAIWLLTVHCRNWATPSDYWQFPVGNESCNLITDSFLWEMSHAVWVLHYTAGDDSCNLITGSLLQEISRAIWLLTVSCRNWVVQSDYWQFNPGNESCNLITDSLLQEMSRAIWLLTVYCRKWVKTFVI